MTLPTGCVLYSAWESYMLFTGCVHRINLVTHRTWDVTHRMSPTGLRVSTGYTCNGHPERTWNVTYRTWCTSGGFPSEPKFYPVGNIFCPVNNIRCVLWVTLKLCPVDDILWVTLKLSPVGDVLWSTLKLYPVSDVLRTTLKSCPVGNMSVTYRIYRMLSTG